MNNMGGFNPHQGIFNNPFQMQSNEELLEQLKSLATYGDHNPTSLALLHELYQRAQSAFWKTNTPTEAVQTDGYLYTSIFKDGEMTHFFVRDPAVKQAIELIFKETEINEPGDPTNFGIDRILRLMELGPIFHVETVDEYGRRTGPSKRRGFATLFGGKGFSDQAQHPSMTIPLVVLEFPFIQLVSSDPSFFPNNILNAGNQFIKDREKLHELEQYLMTTSVLTPYLDLVREVQGVDKFKRLGAAITQVHLFPANSETPIKLVGGTTERWESGFVSREKYPHLFVPTGQPQGGRFAGMATPPFHPW